MATDAAGAQAYVASQTARGRSPPTCARRPPARCSTTLLTKLAPLGPRRLGPDPRWRGAAGRPDRRHPRRQLPARAGAGRQHARRGQAVPDLPAVSPALGGVSGRLVTDAQLFDIQFATTPTRRRRSTIEQWIPAVVPAGDDAGHRLQRAHRAAEPALLRRQPRQHAQRAARRSRTRSGTTASTGTRSRRRSTTSTARRTCFDLPFLFGNFGPSLFSNVANSTANRPGRLELSDAMMRSLGAFARAATRTRRRSA